MMIYLSARIFILFVGGSPVVLGKVFVSSEVDVVSSLLGSEEHFEPKLLEVVIVVGPTGLQHLVPVCVRI